MTAGAVERLHAVAHGVHALFSKINVDHGTIGLEVFALHSAFHRPDIVFETEREFAEVPFGFDGAAIRGDIFRYGAVDEGEGEIASSGFLSSSHSNNLK